MRSHHRSCRTLLLSLLAVVSAAAQAQLPAAGATVSDPAPPRNMGNPGIAGLGPVIDGFSFEGNRKVSNAELAALIQLKPGTPLSSVVIQPELVRITDHYRAHGGAYVQPSIVETSYGHATVIFQVHEGAVRSTAGSEPQQPPAFADKFWGNTMVCAAAQSGNDLCHNWMMADGSLIIFDANGVHKGRWQAGKVLADGRVPICRYWEGNTVPLPPEIVAAKGPPPGPPPAAAGAPPAPRPMRICRNVEFEMQCKTVTDPGLLTAEEKRIAGLAMVERNREIGSCYSHGPHEVGDVWFEWDDYAPGQLGLDRQMLMPGHQ
jgi:hypothetical protein